MEGLELARMGAAQGGSDLLLLVARTLGRLVGTHQPDDVGAIGGMAVAADHEADGIARRHRKRVAISEDALRYSVKSSSSSASSSSIRGIANWVKVLPAGSVTTPFFSSKSLPAVAVSSNVA